MNLLTLLIDTAKMFESLKFLGVGMLSIFAVIGIIIIITVFLNKFTGQKK